MTASSLELAADLVARVEKKAPQAEALASVSKGKLSHLRYAANEITTSGDTDADEVALTVALGARHARATSNRLEADSFDGLVARALTMAELAPEDPEWMPVLGKQETTAAPAGAFDPVTAEEAPLARAAAAKKAIEIARAKGVLGAGFLFSASADVAIVTSAGAEARYVSTLARFTTTARSTDGTGSGWAAAESPRAAEVDTVAAAARAIDKAIQSQKPRELEPGKYTVVLEPACAGHLLSFFVDAMDARSADEGRSFFAKAGGKSRIGEKVIAEGLSIDSDPYDPEAPSTPFDPEGFALAPTTWVERGVLQKLRRSRYWAKKSGGAATGSHATHRLKGGGAGAASVADLIAKVDRGLLVTRFWYIRWLEPKTMAVTGLTRDGVFLIEKGKVTAPVQNFRFNDSPARVFASATAWTTATTRIPGRGSSDHVTRAPALVVHDFNMASKSAAV